MAQLSKVLKVVCWASSVPPSVPAEAGCLFTVAAGVHVFISGESLHFFLVGWCTNKSYVIASSDLWLFIHASNLLPLNSPSPTTVKSNNKLLLTRFTLISSILLFKVSIYRREKSAVNQIHVLAVI